MYSKWESLLVSRPVVCLPQSRLSDKRCCRHSPRPYLGTSASLVHRGYGIVQ
jgi:hypothetical protein